MNNMILYLNTDLHILLTVNMWGMLINSTEFIPTVKFIYFRTLIEFTLTGKYQLMLAHENLIKKNIRNNHLTLLIK